MGALTHSPRGRLESNYPDYFQLAILIKNHLIHVNSWVITLTIKSRLYGNVHFCAFHQFISIYLSISVCSYLSIYLSISVCSHQSIYLLGARLRGVVVNVIDCNLVVNEFELHSRDKFTFGRIPLIKEWPHLIPLLRVK